MIPDSSHRFFPIPRKDISFCLTHLKICHRCRIALPFQPNSREIVDLKKQQFAANAHIHKRAAAQTPHQCNANPISTRLGPLSPMLKVLVNYVS